MATDLTLDNLCDAVRHFLKEAVARHRDGKAFVTPNLDIVGVPGDETMKAVMAAAKNKLTITVLAIGQETADSISAQDMADAAQQWTPPPAAPMRAPIAEKIGAMNAMGESYIDFIRRPWEANDGRS